MLAGLHHRQRAGMYCLCRAGHFVVLLSTTKEFPVASPFEPVLGTSHDSEGGHRTAS